MESYAGGELLSMELSSALSADAFRALLSLTGGYCYKACELNTPGKIIGKTYVFGCCHDLKVELLKQQ